MTTGHKHWAVTVSLRTMRFLQGVTVWRSRDMAYVDRSRFPYTGRAPDDVRPDDRGYWRLSLLGFLHGLTGFCARYRGDNS